MNALNLVAGNIARDPGVRLTEPWALLARILLSERELSRRHVAAELFPEAIDPLGSLRWCLASLRRALGTGAVFSGDPIRHNLSAETEVDIYRLEAGDFCAGAAGGLLAGVEPRCSPEFATWLLVERERMAGLIDARIRQEVMLAISVGRYDRAIRLAELGVRRLPFDESAHILLVKSLTLAGSHEAALDHVEATEQVFFDELGVKPLAALRSAARRTISAPPGGVSPQAVVKSLLASGQAALGAGAADAGVDCLRRAVADAEKSEDHQLQAQSLLELGTALVHAIRGYDDEAAILRRQSVELAQQCSDARVATAALRELGYLEALAGRRPVAAAHLAKALEITDDPESLAGAHAVIGFNLVDWGKAVEGPPWPPDKLNRHFGNLVRKAGIGPITFHGLRHTLLTILWREGVHPKVASERAGHSSVATILDLCSHAAENLQREAAEKVDMAMRNALEGRNRPRPGGDWVAIHDI